MMGKLQKLIFTSLLSALSALSIVSKPKPSLAAERISFSLPVLGEFHIGVDDLEVFAKEGTITKDFAFYAKYLDEKTLAQFREALQQKFDFDPSVIYKLTNAPIGEKFLRQLGEVVSTHPERNGIYAIRAAVLLAATDSEGLTAINVMRKFPTQKIRVDTNLVFSLIEEANSFLAYKDSTVKAIAKIAESEISSQPTTDFATVEDIRQSGTYSVRQEDRTFPINQIRQTTMGFSDSYDLNADIYLPEGTTNPTPLLVVTHGFGSSRSDFQDLATHLASYGYIVLVPEHIGSDQEYQKAFLRGELSVDVSPIEFYSRPQEITYLLNGIEKDTELNQLIDWEQVGIFGHSFGGNTALAVAGAPINQTRINKVCQQNQPSLNVSMLLQCRANGLPSGNYNLRDERIKAVVAANPVTSTALGVENMGKIEVPTMLLAGSEDKTTPFIPEQAHPFLWLQTQHKYLGIIEGGTHGYSLNNGESEGFATFLENPQPELRRKYIKAASLAFFEVHLRNNSDYQSRLSAAYARNISNDELPFHLVRSLSTEQLQQAYGDTPPLAPIPEPVVAAPPQTSENVISQIRETKTLKVAMRSDAAPFGYVDNQDNVWTGYCDDFADSFGAYLEKELNIDGGIEVAKIHSTLENRFQLVTDNAVHLECGSNTIQSDRRDVSFSLPIYVSGTRFLVTKEKASQIDPDGTLENVKTGVLGNTTTVEFVGSSYPETEIVLLNGDRARSDGIKALTEGTIDTMVSDGILLLGEIDRQNKEIENYRLIPENPLTCDFYGLILPKGEPQWRRLVNDFIDSEKDLEIKNKWVKKYSDRALSDADYCLNRR